MGKTKQQAEDDAALAAIMEKAARMAAKMIAEAGGEEDFIAKMKDKPDNFIF